MAVHVVRHKKPKEISRTSQDYTHQDWPMMFYGPEGQQQVFNNPLEVPEDWHDHPDKVGDSKAKTEIPGYDEAVAAAESGGTTPENEDIEELKKGDEELGLPAYDDITANQIKTALDKEGVPHDTDDKLTLYTLYRDTLAGEA